MNRDEEYADIWSDMWVMFDIMDSIIKEVNQWSNCRKLNLVKRKDFTFWPECKSIGDLIDYLERCKKRILDTVIRTEVEPREGVFAEVHVDFSKFMPREYYHQRLGRLVHFLQSHYYCHTIIAHVKRQPDVQYKIVEMNIGQFYHTIMRGGGPKREELIQIPGMIEWIIEE